MKGEKLDSETILPNFERSFMESWAAWVWDPISSESLTSKMAYPDEDSKRAWVIIVKMGLLAVRDGENDGRKKKVENFARQIRRT